MEFSTGGGLNNHRQVLTVAAVLAIASNRTLVVPQQIPDPHGPLVIFDRLWDLQKLSRLVPLITTKHSLGRTPPLVLAARPWCCDLTAADIAASPVGSASEVVTFAPLAGWVWPLPYLAPSLRRLLAAVTNVVSDDLMACAKALVASLEARSRTRAAHERGCGGRRAVLHAAHVRLGDKVACPMLQCEECGLVYRDLVGFKHRACDCKRPGGPMQRGGDGPAELRPRYWRSETRWGVSQVRNETNAEMGDAIECAVSRQRACAGDGVYIATNRPADSAEIQRLSSTLHEHGLRPLTWEVDLAPLLDQRKVVRADEHRPRPAEAAMKAASEKVRTAPRPTGGKRDATRGLREVCAPLFRDDGSLDASAVSFVEQLVCAAVPGHFFAHFASSWSEFVLHLRATRRRNGAVTFSDALGELALHESKLRVALATIQDQEAANSPAFRRAGTHRMDASDSASSPNARELACGRCLDDDKAIASPMPGVGRSASLRQRDDQREG